MRAPYALDGGMQALHGRIVAGDQAHGLSLVRIRHHIQRGVHHGGTLANQVHIAMQTKAHDCIDFERLRPRGFRLQLRQI